ncbi:MAG TPA: nuclear transport factor 2 family protein [Thermoleophilaceae bacterium]
MHEFRTAIEQARASGEVDGLMALLAEDVVFRSPVVYAPYKGRAAVEPLLRAVVRVFDDFEFTRMIGEPGAADHACVFHGWIGDREVEGCDFLHTGHNGLIDEFYVMVRPISAAMALAQAITNQLVLEQSEKAA